MGNLLRENVKLSCKKSDQDWSRSGIASLPVSGSVVASVLEKLESRDQALDVATDLLGEAGNQRRRGGKKRHKHLDPVKLIVQELFDELAAQGDQKIPFKEFRERLNKKVVETELDEISRKWFENLEAFDKAIDSLRKWWKSLRRGERLVDGGDLNEGEGLRTPRSP